MYVQEHGSYEHQIDNVQEDEYEHRISCVPDQGDKDQTIDEPPRCKEFVFLICERPVRSTHVIKLLRQTGTSCLQRGRTLFQVSL